ncbi:MAG: ABC transporter permease, partial [Clostridia bacterium]|nr:ABC transporter permease [Clostridia bacterium]
MFLAFKELKYSKTKFALIISVIVLISYLVYFLTSLAYGLASSYTNAIEKWQANEIVLTVDANDNMMMSYMTQENFDAISTTGEKAKLGLFPAVISNPLAENILESRVDVYFFGIENDSFLKPYELENLTLTGNKVIVDEKLKKEGYKIGDTFAVTGSENQFEIIGFSAKSTYQTAPVVYMSLDSWQEYRYGTLNTPDLFSGVVVRGQIDNLPEEFLSYTTSKYISTLPGYTAQVLTFSVMIGFLIIITAFVLGIFIYVLTIQKTSMFGVMKAQGISNGYIGG